MASLRLCQAAAAATAFILTESLIPSWEWRGVDLAATFLNVSGSAIAGMAKGGAKADDTSDVRAALSILMTGFLAVWTSLAATVEHSSHLAVAKGLWAGIGYLVSSVLVGTIVYLLGHRIGRQWRVSRKTVDWAKRGPLWLVSGMERGAVLCAVGAVAWGSWMAGQTTDRLAWGVVMAIIGGVIGDWFSGLNKGQEGRVNWGDWRCNTLSFAGVVSAGRYVASLDPDDRESVLHSAFFAALVAQGIGTISGFSDLSAGAGDLTLDGDYRAAAANVALNLATGTVALLARSKAEKVLLEKVYTA